MIKKHYLTLDDEFINYCQLNGVDNIDKLALETFRRGFTMLKYGDTTPTPILQKEPLKTKEKTLKQKVVKPTEKPTIITRTENNDLYDE